MITPDRVKYEAKKKETENINFRTFLKCNADEQELDRQFQQLHAELFDGYDCSRCRNCCKMYYGSIRQEDLEQDAALLNMEKEEFINTYLVKEETEEGYSTRHKPCDFLEKDGSCRLGECRPDNCKKYPYTDQPDRLWSLYSVLEAVEVCPVAFEIFERLKQEYGFNRNRRRR